VLAALAGRGVTRLLVEGGVTVARAFADVADRLELFTAPHSLGAKGGGDLDALSLNFLRVNKRVLGPDMLESYVRRA
jgi:diaminohydroxyphosphoribosylaminopyrimidine deaminase/5-amino-6-(5-phosphoribosylamino)uracil reductase